MTLNATVTGTIEDFDEAAYKRNLAILCNVEEGEVQLTITGGSVYVVAVIVVPDVQSATFVVDIIADTLRSSNASDVLGVNIIITTPPAIDSVILPAPSPPPSPRPRGPPPPQSPPSPSPRPIVPPSLPPAEESAALLIAGVVVGSAVLVLLLVLLVGYIAKLQLLSGDGTMYASASQSPHRFQPTPT